MERHIIEFLNSPALFAKISDLTRIVDPLQKTVTEYKDRVAVIDEAHCFDFWDKNKICDNCISMRAFNDNITYTKIEYTRDKTYLITAVPYHLTDRRIVIELLKDITQSVLYDVGTDTVLEQIGIHALIDNLNKLAFSDSLTGLYNRRFLMEKLPVDLLNSILSAAELSIIMVDIDHFKKINDTYGHLGGDHILKHVAATLSGCLTGTSDWIARFGGEEFVICMPGVNLEAAKATAESMRELLEHSGIRYQEAEFSVTASFGISNLKSAGQESAEDLIRRADEKLYLAKSKGRNRVEF
ncbi:MAG: GGDEF domain-containing protein [Negativicutes bacterium]|nr:GGDEF domain-containing protein [Negativicutes bacterium]